MSNKNLKNRINFKKQFREDMKGFTRQASTAITKGALETLKYAQEQTPVWSGLMRANWKLGITKSSYVPKPRHKTEKGTVQIKPSKFKFFLTKHKGFTIYNNTPYAPRIDEKGSPLGRGQGILTDVENKLEENIQKYVDAIK